MVRDQDTKEAVVVDVTVPYETGSEKYARLKTWMESQRENSTLTAHAFVVGALAGARPTRSVSAPSGCQAGWHTQANLPERQTGKDLQTTSSCQTKF